MKPSNTTRVRDDKLECEIKWSRSVEWRGTLVSREKEKITTLSLFEGGNGGPAPSNLYTKVGSLQLL